MQVIIPLAGKGARLRPHTHSKAKPLLHVAGKTVLSHILDGIKDNKEISEIIFITGHLGHQIQDFVKANYDFKTRYIEQEELKGQAHAIKLAEKYINEDVLIWFVDTISDADISKLRDVKEDGVIYVKEVKNPGRFGQVKSGKDNIVTAIKEKADPPVSNLVNIGLYYVKDFRLMFKCIDELIEKNMQTKGEFFLMDAFEVMIAKGTKFRSIEVNVWEDCGTKEAVLKTNKYFLSTHGGKTIKTINSVIIPPVHIESSAKIEGSVIGPYVSVADNAVIKNSIVEDSIISENAVVENAILRNSLIGDNSVFKGKAEKLNIGDSSEIVNE